MAADIDPNLEEPEAKPELLFGDLGQGKLSQETTDTLARAAEVIQRDHGTKNGQTALYWHLVAIASSHVR